MSVVRVRFAPSPTGPLHLGVAMSAVANFLFALRARGSFVLRIDDTDRERSNPMFESAIRDEAAWLGLRFDEGPGEGGAYAPYRQSERQDLYQRHAKALVASGHASFSAGAVVFAAPTKDVVVPDAARGDVRVAASAITEFVLLRSDGSATYQLATCVDDASMDITHVIRGEDHLTNTARQLLLYQALGFAPPVFAHTALLVDEDGSKLSKRTGTSSIAELREAGYPPEALLNYLAELACPALSVLAPAAPADLASALELSGVSRGPSRFDNGRLRWLSQEHLKRLGPIEVAGRVASILRQRGVQVDRPRLAVISEGLAGCYTLTEAADEAEAVLVGPTTTAETDPTTRVVLAAFAEARTAAPAALLAPDQAEAVIDAVTRRCAEHGLSAGIVKKTLRRALTGRDRGIALRYVVAVAQAPGRSHAA